MKSTEGQKYTQNLFFAGLAADIDPELLDQKSGAVLEAHGMHLDNKSRNKIKKLRGDKWFVEEQLLGDQVFVGAVWVSGYVVEFWRDIVANYTNIYANGLLIAQHADLPGDSTHMLDIDTNNENELFITDNKQCPIVLDLDEMLTSVTTQIYFMDYDKSLYEINRSMDLGQPRFQRLEDVGSGGGLKAGSYSYAIRFSTLSGEKSAWGPMTPYIPVPYDTKPFDDSDPARAYNGILICGQEPSLTPTKYGIRLRIRINNTGFDYVELKRYTNNTGQSVSYVPVSEYIRLSLDADGALVNIKNNSNCVIDFIDTDSLSWAILDDTENNTYSTIKSSRTIRYYDKRIVLGGVEYESKLISDKDIFINHSDVAKIAFPCIEQLDYNGYTDMQNQVYKKSHRLGERYGFALKLYDNQGNMLYAVPLIKDIQDFTNYRFPNRRSVIPTAERPYSPDAQNISTIYSFDETDTVHRTNYVYEPIESALIKKNLVNPTPSHRNIVDNDAPDGSGIIYNYNPFTPTGIDAGYGNNGNDLSGLDVDYMWLAEGGAYNTNRHGTIKSAVGLSIGGVDISKLPSWVKSFGVVRTPAAGRVVCQGIAMYALTPTSYAGSPSLIKAKNKVWFYSPELDLNIGDRVSVFDDMIANPSDYQIQLVSPVGFFTDVYSAYQDGSDKTLKIDMISHAIMGGNSIHSMEPVGFDTSSTIGVGQGRPTFGRFRNYYVWPATDRGSGLVDSDLTFNISSAIEPSINTLRDSNGRSRTPYLELTLGSNIYYYTDVDSESGTTNTSRKFHEPWYVVNIIKEGKNIANNNVNSYNDIGHFIKIESFIGVSNGNADQVFELINERYEDVYTLGETTDGYRYIWVDGRPWLGANNIGAGNLGTYRASLSVEDVFGGSFTPVGGLECYGLYYVEYSVKDTGPAYEITFPYVNIPGGYAICPSSGSEIKVRYNNNSPIKLFLGDIYIHDAIFAPIDCNLENIRSLASVSGFLLNAPMPYWEFVMNANNYLPARSPESGSTLEEIFEIEQMGHEHHMNYIRQWLVSFGCESSVNLPFIYKNYYPNRNYVMRPAIYNIKLDTETVAEYLDDVGIYSYYDTDYPDECLRWGYGGFHLPVGANWDYEKKLHDRVFTEPASGVNEVLSLMKRIHWATRGLPEYPASRSFIPTNIYDLQNDKATQISILYDVFTDRGNNLYVITDRGVGLLLTNKQLISDAGGNALSIMANEASIIQGELWLNNSIGCPREFWRGKSEGNVKLANNVKVPMLVFPTYNDVVLFSVNNFMELADNNRQNIVNSLKEIDLTRDFITNLYSVIDEGENNLWICIGDTTYVFNFDGNNWCAHMEDLEYVKSLYAPYLQGVDDRNVLAHIIGGENVLPAPTTTAAPVPVTTEVPPTTAIPTTTGIPISTTTPAPVPTTTAGPTTTFDPADSIILPVQYVVADGYEGSPFPAWCHIINNTGDYGWLRVYYQILDRTDTPILGPDSELIYLWPGDYNYLIWGLTYPAFDGNGTDNTWQISKNGVDWVSQIGHFNILDIP